MSSKVHQSYASRNVYLLSYLLPSQALLSLVPSCTGKVTRPAAHSGHASRILAPQAEASKLQGGPSACSSLCYLKLTPRSTLASEGSSCTWCALRQLGSLTDPPPRENANFCLLSLSLEDHDDLSVMIILGEKIQVKNLQRFQNIFPTLSSIPNCFKNYPSI